MDLIVCAMLGGSIGWGSSRMMCPADGRLALTTNILTGLSGAVIAGWFLIPLLREGARDDFTVTAPVVSLGALLLMAALVFMRRLGRRRRGSQARGDSLGSL